MKINPTTGELQIAPSGFALMPSLTKAAFLASAEGKTAWMSVANPPFATYALSVNDDSGEFVLRLVFNQEKIDTVSVAKGHSSRNWTDWSEENEMQIKAEHDRLLAAMLGAAPHRFPWGEVVSDYDPRSGASTISIRYTQK